MTKSTGVGRGGSRAGAGRKSRDGRPTITCVPVSLDQESFDLLVNEFGALKHGFGYAVREACHRILGGHCKSLTAAGAAEVLKVAGGPANVLKSAAGGAGAERRRGLAPRAVVALSEEELEEEELNKARAVVGLPLRRGRVD